MVSVGRPEADPLATAKMSAVSTKQAAWIGASAAALAAVLSLLSAVVSGNITARSTAKVTEQQLSGETAKSRAEFTRSQRQTAYATFLADENQLRFTEWRLRNIVVVAVPSMKEYTTQANLADDYLVKLARDIGNVEVIGGQDSINAIEKMKEIHWRRSAWVLYGRAFLPSSDAYDGAKKKDLYEGLVAEDAELRQLQVDFKLAARADLAN